MSARAPDDAPEDEFIVFGRPDIQQPEIDEVLDSLTTGWLGTGPKVHRFERDFAAYKEVPAGQVAALNSCTAALHVSLVVSGVQPGQEVITSAMTFCATANAIIHAGGTPVPVDIDPDTLNLDPEQVRAAITDRTYGIVPVHFAGRPCDMDAIMAIAQEHGLVVVEDCAHAIETRWRDRPAGTLGDFGCFSFYATKNVATGEGGMVIARDAETIDRIKVLSLHGMSKDAWHRFSDEGYEHYRLVDAGFKYNMMDLQAAIGIHQLRRVEANWLRRKGIWARYQRAFAHLPVGRPSEPTPEMRHGHHLYTLTVDEARCGISRDAFIERMRQAGIGVGVHYVSLAQHPYYVQRYGWRAAAFPHAEAFGASTVSLPLSPGLTDAQVERVVEAVVRILPG